MFSSHHTVFLQYNNTVFQQQVLYTLPGSSLACKCRRSVVSGVQWSIWLYLWRAVNRHNRTGTCQPWCMKPTAKSWSGCCTGRHVYPPSRDVSSPIPGWTSAVPRFRSSKSKKWHVEVARPEYFNLCQSRSFTQLNTTSVWNSCHVLKNAIHIPVSCHANYSEQLNQVFSDYYVYVSFHSNILTNIWYQTNMCSFEYLSHEKAKTTTTSRTGTSHCAFSWDTWQYSHHKVVWILYFSGNVQFMLVCQLLVKL